ncbi:MAG TPA: PQQ-binding-like beta-propeller repeat protein [Candidatus Parabacteroides intestinipullorum]|uniref:PQQ-binding-like beta-propeller repeat protein n=1 Tax=Candidatus Parabacteroides intestinipullorum TaxID=2838723 RepID=A0A9D1X997_9BACT|nr:PQQ-binding-like beta-propeller repeat protein [Candidatus Parabacteroides intestinipullorum]
MKKLIFRNIAILSAIFIVTLSIMLVTNYFQIKDVTPLQTEVVESLKQLNDSGVDVAGLQDQIRQLDLLARKAYFVRMDHLEAGLYILLGMFLAFILSLRYYFKDLKEIPAMEIDPVDDWLIKTNARRYVLVGASGLATLAVVFALLSMPGLKKAEGQADPAAGELTAEATESASSSSDESPAPAEAADAAEGETLTATPEATAPAAGPAENGEAAQAPAQAPASNASYQGFRGNNSNGYSTAKNVPTKWNLADGSNILWKQSVPRSGHNSPVIVGNNVFFSGADDQARELYCYDLNTGEKRWTVSASGIPGSPKTMPKTSHGTGLAASTVVADGGHVCAIFATGDMICADTNGKLLWSKNVGVPDNHYGYASSLLLFRDMVIVQYDNQANPRVFALDLATGAEKWSKSRPEKITWSSPIIATVNNQPQLVLMGNPAITAYNPTNGEQLWRVECLTGEVGSSPCSANGVVFGASEYSKLVAINGADGSVLWESTDYLPEVSSPVATKDNLYLATSYGVVAAFDAKTGELRKEHDLGVEFYSSPVIVGGKMYLFSNSGKMHIFSADNEFQLLDSFETGETTMSTPAFTDGKIVVRTESSIYCVAAK